MKFDSRGLPVTTDSDGAIGAIDHYASELLSLGPDSGAILDAADSFPDCAIIQAYAASSCVYAQSPAQARNARPLLIRARRRFDDLTSRQRLFVRSGQTRAASTALREYIGARGVTRLEQRWLEQVS